MDFNENLFSIPQQRNQTLTFNNISNLILQKIFKFTAITAGLFLVFLVFFDIGETIVKTCRENNLNENLQILERNYQQYKRRSLQQISDIIETDGDTNNSTSTEEDITSKIEKELIEKLNEFDKQTQDLINKDTEIIQEIDLFYERISRYTYHGNWMSLDEIDSFENKHSGELAFKIQKVSPVGNIISSSVFLVFRLLDGVYIDRWLFGRSFNNNQNITLNNNSISISYVTYLDYGEIFERKNSTVGMFYIFYYYILECNSTFSFNWSTNKPVEIDEELAYQNITGSFKSDCGLSYTFSVTIEEEYEDYGKVMVYSIVVTILALSQIFNSIWLINRISDSQSTSNSVRKYLNDYRSLYSL